MFQSITPFQNWLEYCHPIRFWIEYWSVTGPKLLAKFQYSTFMWTLPLQCSKIDLHIKHSNFGKFTCRCINKENFDYCCRFLLFAEFYTVTNFCAVNKTDEGWNTRSINPEPLGPSSDTHEQYTAKKFKIRHSCNISWRTSWKNFLSYTNKKQDKQKLWLTDSSVKWSVDF